MTDLAVRILEVEEGFSAEPYYCTAGYPTIGYGQRIGAKDTPLEVYQFTLPQLAAQKWLEYQVFHIFAKLTHDSDLDAVMRVCNPVREAVLICMCYQLGHSGLKSFKRTLNHIERCDWGSAANEMLMSRWYDQTPYRAERMSDLMESGELLELKEFYNA